MKKLIGIIAVLAFAGFVASALLLWATAFPWLPVTTWGYTTRDFYQRMLFTTGGTVVAATICFALIESALEPFERDVEAYLEKVEALKRFRFIMRNRHRSRPYGIR